MERILRTTNPHGNRQDWRNVRRLLPFLWEYRGRVLLALLSLVLAKLANVGVPLALKHLVDALDHAPATASALPLALLLAYGALKLSSSLLNELRDAVFAKVRYRAMRRVSTQVLRHLHTLSLRFHLERRTGAISRDVERGTGSVSTILNYMIFNIIPTAVEFTLVAAVLLASYDPHFALLIFGTVALYVAFTLAVTEWRMHFRHEMNALDSRASNLALDGLMNYETVKYFNNEAYELRRYDATLGGWEQAAVKSQTSMSALNFGQGAIIAMGATVVMVFAARQVVHGGMSLGDLVLVNAFLLQLFMPLNFLGIVYRQIKYSLADMDSMFKLVDTPPEIVDASSAVDLAVNAGVVRFEAVDFSYREDRRILHGIDMEIPAGHKVAVVGASGAGKSTLARLLFRFYSPTAGRILIDDQDIAGVTQRSLRQAVGIVPQDTVLFNDTIYYNIHYADPQAGCEQVEGAARLAHIHEFIASLPEGYDTVVGERGLKLSGGEKQRVAIARAILKNPRILVFDEATSALDSHSEQAILGALREVAQHHTTLVIAHRLSTIVDADTIVVMEHGRIVERGSHTTLLQAGGSYARMWALQQRERREVQAESRLYALQSA